MGCNPSTLNSTPEAAPRAARSTPATTTGASSNTKTTNNNGATSTNEAAAESGGSAKGNDTAKLEPTRTSFAQSRRSSLDSQRSDRRDFSKRAVSRKDLEDCRTYAVIEIDANEKDRPDCTFKPQVQAAQTRLRIYESPLSDSDKVMVMQGWNKVLAFKTAFSEGLVAHWRVLVAQYEIEQKASEKIDKDGRLKVAFSQVEKNQDPIAKCFADRIIDEGEDLIMGFLDASFRSLCPKHQLVLRESYRPIEDDIAIARRNDPPFLVECETARDYTRLFARCGVKPMYWALFVDAFIWAMRTHVPYSQDDDKDDLDKGPSGAFIRAVAQVVALEAIEAHANLKRQLNEKIFTVGVKRLWGRLDRATRDTFGETFYRSLLTNHPELLEYFSRTDMDSLALHFINVLDLLVQSIAGLGDADTNFRKALEALASTHRIFRIATFTYPIVGAQLLECLEPVFDAEAEESQNSEYPVTADQLHDAFLLLYGEVMSLLMYPMLREEKMVHKATELYQQIKVELNWSEAQFMRRMFEVGQEINKFGTYTQTSEEIEIGCRLAWRNSAKCIGRISWNTLQVRDCRHISEPADIFRECEEHIKIACAGTNIQSVMTVFKPKSIREPIGTRFWSTQFVRYAAYEIDVTDSTGKSTGETKILGDPANKDLTDYLIKNDLWVPPSPKTKFDVLPLVLKVPGRSKPFVHTLAKDVVFEVPLEHPSKPEITSLGYKWTPVPALTNLKINLGGVVYQNMPFNGWFLSTEIVRNLMERYGAGPECAKVLGIDTTTDPMWQSEVFTELERAVIHSFNKYGFTVVDPMAVGKSFCTHVRREREQYGRECPGQWSWIGGLTGSTNPTWHLEMRDFLINPQYAYCINGLALYNSETDTSGARDSLDDVTVTTASTTSTFDRQPHVVIAYGSETGNAEAAARRLKRELQLLKPTLKSINELCDIEEFLESNKITHLLCICSTFGKGNPPQNAAIFFDLELKAYCLEDLKFSVLALGSTLYPDFCKAGITLDNKLANLGGDRMLPVEKADDAAGADGKISTWINMMKRNILPPDLEYELLKLNLSSSEPPVHKIHWTGGTSLTNDANGSSGSDWLCLLNETIISKDDKDPDSRSVHKISFKLPDGVTYETGDHLCVHPLNSKKMVNDFLKCFETELVGNAKDAASFPHPKECSTEIALEWISKQLFELQFTEDNVTRPADVFFKTPTCLYNLLLQQMDMSLSARNVIDYLSVCRACLSSMLDKLDPTKGEDTIAMKHPSIVGFNKYIEFIFNGKPDQKTSAIHAFIAEFPTIVDFLGKFRNLFLEDFTKDVFGWSGSPDNNSSNGKTVEGGPILKLAELLAVMPRLQPRYYSISSSSRAKPNEVLITVAVLSTKTSKGVPVEGVCSHYLAGLNGGIDKAKIDVCTSSFRLPKDLMAPIIMVGAGTGLSPLMAFLEERALDLKDGNKKIGPIKLFFGCRTERDFIYEDLIRKYEKDGLLQLFLALSRSKQCRKKYVQNCIEDEGKVVSQLLRGDSSTSTHYYVCGDARMADGCYEACLKAIQQQCVVSRISAVRHLQSMQVDGRWQNDVWGIVSHFEESKKSMEKQKRIAAKIWLSKFS